MHIRSYALGGLLAAASLLASTAQAEMRRVHFFGTLTEVTHAPGMSWAFDGAAAGQTYQGYFDYNKYDDGSHHDDEVHTWDHLVTEFSVTVGNATVTYAPTMDPQSGYPASMITIDRRQQSAYMFADYRTGGGVPINYASNISLSGATNLTNDVDNIGVLGWFKGPNKFNFQGCVAYTTCSTFTGSITRMVSPVPLPAAGWLLLSGLGIGLVRRKRNGAESVAEPNLLPSA